MSIIVYKVSLFYVVYKILSLLFSIRKLVKGLRQLYGFSGRAPHIYVFDHHYHHPDLLT